MRRQLAAITIPLTILLGLCAVAAVSSVRLSHSADEADAFTAYAALMPGQPMVVPAACQFQQTISMAEGTAHSYCQMASADGPFRSVIVTLNQGQVEEVWFNVQGLAISDLVRHFGQPDQVSSDERYFYLA